MHATVSKRDLVAAGHVEVDSGVYQLVVGQRRQIAFLRRALIHDVHLVSRGRSVVAAFPLRFVGVPVHQATLAVIGVLIPGHEPAARAAFLQVGFLQQARLQLFTGKVGHHLHVCGQRVIAPACGFHVVDHQDGAVRPALDELPVHQVMLDDDVLPAQRQRAVGAGFKVQPVVGFLARTG